MSFLPGTSIRVYANEFAVSGNVSGVNAQHQRATSDVTVVTSGGGMNYVPGLMSGSLALRGPLDSSSDLAAEILAAIGVDNNVLITACSDGTAVGKPALFMIGDPTEYTMDASVSDALGYVVTSTADESVDMGYVLVAPSAITADGNGTAVDRGTSLSYDGSTEAFTIHGGVAALHVSAYSGFTSVALKIQHSPDNSAWSDLASFASVTAVGWQRLSVANGTQINRYVRAVTDVTGTGSITYLMAFAPR